MDVPHKRNGERKQLDSKENTLYVFSKSTQIIYSVVKLE